MNGPVAGARPSAPWSARRTAPVLVAVLAMVLAPALPADATPRPAPAGAVVPVPAAPAYEDLLWLQVDEVGLGRLSRTRVMRWQIGAHLTGAPEGRLTVELAARGELARTASGVLVQVESCTSAWTEDRATCPGDRTLLMPWHRVVPDEDGEQVPVGRLTPTESHWLLVSLTLPEATPTTSQQLRTEIGLGLTATGDDRFPTAPPQPPVVERPAPERPRPDRPRPVGPSPDTPDRPSPDTPGPDTPSTDRPSPDTPSGPVGAPVEGPGGGGGDGSSVGSPDGVALGPVPPGRSHATGDGAGGSGAETTAAGRAGALARTGAMLLQPLLLAVGAVVAGLLLAAAARCLR